MECWSIQQYMRQLFKKLFLSCKMSEQLEFYEQNALDAVGESWGLLAQVNLEFFEIFSEAL